MNIKPIISLLTVFISISAWGQSDFDLSQRWFNESVYNPAATGNSFTTGIFIHSRAQWLNTEGTPITNAFSFDTYAEHLRSAFGIAVTTDKIGYLNSWSAKVSYAYYIPLGTSTLSLGLSGYILNRNKHIQPDMAENPSDPSITYTKVNEYNPDFDLGIEYKGPFKIGVSVRHLLNTQKVNSAFTAYTTNIWSYASSRFNLSENISAEPVVSYMYRNNINRYEAGAIVYFLKSQARISFNDRFWLGAMYRFNSQFAILAGANITSKIGVGYSFDYGTGDLSNISKSGTHEIFLSWQFNKIFYKEPNCPAYRNYRK